MSMDDSNCPDSHSAQAISIRQSPLQVKPAAYGHSFAQIVEFYRDDKPQKPASISLVQNRVVQVSQYGNANSQDLRLAFSNYGIVHHVQRWESKTSRKKHAFVTFYCAPAAARVLALKDGPLGSRDGLGDMKVQALQLPAFTAHYLAPKMGKNAKRRARADELIRESAAQTRRLLAEERETEDVLRAEIDFEQACLDRTVEDIGLMDIRAKEIKAKRFKLLCHHQEIQERCAVRHKFLESEQALLDQFQNRVEDLERYMVPAMWPLAFAIDDLAKRRGAEAVEKKNKCSLRCVCPHFTAKCLNILADGVLDTEPAYSSIESAQAQ